MILPVEEGGDRPGDGPGRVVPEAVGGPRGPWRCGRGCLRRRAAAPRRRWSAGRAPRAPRARGADGGDPVLQPDARRRRAAWRGCGEGRRAGSRGRRRTPGRAAPSGRRGRGAAPGPTPPPGVRSKAGLSRTRASTRGGVPGGQEGRHVAAPGVAHEGDRAEPALAQDELHGLDGAGRRPDPAGAREAETGPVATRVAERSDRIGERPEARRRDARPVEHHDRPGPRRRGPQEAPVDAHASGGGPRAESARMASAATRCATRTSGRTPPWSSCTASAPPPAGGGARRRRSNGITG